MTTDPALPELIHDPKPNGSARSLTTEPKASHAILLTASQLLRGLARLVFVVLVARVLGPSRFGIYTLLLAMVEMLAVASGSGYTDFLTREAAKDEKLGWGICGQLTWLRLAYTVPFTAVGLGLLWLLKYPGGVIAATACLAVSLIPRSLSESVQGVLRGIGRFTEFFFVEFVFAAVLLAGVIFLLISGGDLNAVIGVEILAAGSAAVIASLFALKFRTKERFGLGELDCSEPVPFSTYMHLWAISPIGSTW